MNYLINNTPSAFYELTEYILQITATAIAQKRDICVVCIGCESCLGDSLGPLVGNILNKTGNFFVYGDFGNNIVARNVSAIVGEIKKTRNNPYLIAVDACVGKPENVGKIRIGTGSIKPGAGVGRDLQEVGDAYIVAIVAEEGLHPFLKLQSVPLGLILSIAKTIAKSLQLASYAIQRDEVVSEIAISAEVNNVPHRIKFKLKRKKQAFRKLSHR